MKPTRLAFWTLALCVTFAIGAVAAEPAAAAAKIEIIVPANLKWGPPPGFPPDAPGPRLAILWGDPQKGPVGFFLKQLAGSSSGVHEHATDYLGVVIQGEVTATVTDDKNAPGFGPGSFWKQPGNQWHSNTCKSAVDCITYIEFKGGITFTPKDPPKPAKPAKPAK